MNYVTSLLPSLMEGLLETLKIFAVTLALSLPLGVIVALGRLSKIKIINTLAQGYIWIMRGTPLLLQIIFIFFGLPIIGVTLDRFPAAILAFVLNYGAYFGEIFRAGIESIDKGQYEASEVLGMSNSQTFFRIVLPQMIKRVLPPVSNEVITLVKDTALVYVVGLDELLRFAKIASNRDASLIPLVVVAVFYLLLTAILTKVFQSLEKKYSYYS
ncbi:amino acid ABC transporter permease [Clostridium sp. 'White wine YQ']|uniref:amino acid ABC transporter permease n=1 Tax=Clostridium sp. 'White wine YQ' TaxID=3027474 RepID=UPI002365F52F|nr:amino acid ABC transporter permease [Clostridium sp. 'White wine YQ']MDD7795179.1 amino acid ABC transporter permease [Clostridium sp. 'White wine YQ']